MEVYFYIETTKKKLSFTLVGKGIVKLWEFRNAASSLTILDIIG